jgi:predicted Zn-dependent protease
MNPWTKLALGLAAAGTLSCAAASKLMAKADPETQAKVEKCQKFEKLDVDPKEERALGGALAVGMVAHNNGVAFGSTVASKDDPVNVYVNEVGRNVARLSARPGLEWTFGVINSPDLNAFSTPGGYVFVSRGLLKAVPNEAALAGVLGHEVAHVVFKHALSQYKHVKTEACESAISQELASSAVSSVVGQLSKSFSSALGQPKGFVDLDNALNFKALFGLAGELESKITSSGFARDQEFDADKLGLQLTINAGYNPQPYIDFVSKLPDGGAFAHHPKSADRVVELQKWPSWLEEQQALVAASDVRAYPKVPLDSAVASLGAP